MANPTLKLSVNSTFQSDPARGHELSVAPGFGIRSDGSAYYQPGGAVAGEAAWVRLDSSGLFKLEQDAPALLFGLIEGDARPVELGEHVTGPVTEKPGVMPGAPTMVAPGGRDGRPVHVHEPQTLALASGRPVAVHEHQTLPIKTGRPSGSRPKPKRRRRAT